MPRPAPTGMATYPELVSTLRTRVGNALDELEQAPIAVIESTLFGLLSDLNALEVPHAGGKAALPAPRLIRVRTLRG